jgi:hypothetical protein
LNPELNFNDTNEPDDINDLNVINDPNILTEISQTDQKDEIED